MIIDAHNHPDWCGKDFDAFIADMDKNGIDKTWLLTWEAPFGDYSPFYLEVTSGHLFKSKDTQSYPVPFERCIDYIQRAPERFVLGYAPDLRRVDALSCMKSAVSIYGVKVCGEVKLRMLYDNPDAVEIFKFCGDANIPVTLHFDYPEATKKSYNYPRSNWWYGGSIDTLEHLLNLCPKTNFLGHAPGFWGHISNDDLVYTESNPKGPVIEGGKIEYLLGKYKNLYCDISANSGYNALSRDKDYSYKLINKFPERFVYARDCFNNTHQEIIEELNLNKDVKELIYCGNAQRLISK